MADKRDYYEVLGVSRNATVAMLGDTAVAAPADGAVPEKAGARGYHETPQRPRLKKLIAAWL